jgi:PAS domain S-box-containing protein
MRRLDIDPTDISGDALVTKTLDGIVVGWSAGAEKLFGYTAEEMIGQPILRLFPADYRQDEDTILTRLGAGERIEPRRTLQVTKEGRGIDVLLTLVPLKDHNGHIVGGLQVIRDLTDRQRSEASSPAREEGLRETLTARKQAEEALLETEEGVRSIVQSTDDAIIVMDTQGQVAFWNRGAEKMFGYAAEEMMGRPVTRIVPERFRDAHQRGVQRVAAAGRLTVQANMFELVGLRKDGTECPVEFSLAAWTAKQGLLITGILRDITERKRAEAALRLAHAELEERVAARTADLASANMRLHAEVAERKRAEEALRDAQKRLQRWNVELEQAVNTKTAELLQSQERLRALATELNLAEQRERKRLATELHDYLQQMLVFGKMQIGQGKRYATGLPGCEDVMNRVDEIFSDALMYTRTLVADLSPPVLRDHGLFAGLKWLGEQMQKHNMTVKAIVPEKELTLPEDQQVLLFQSVRELLINASKHAGTDEALVKVEVQPSCLRIAVSDEGKGFDLAAADSTPSAGISSKFGLFSIRERMRALGGSFDLESAPGKGTCATLMVPLEDIPAARRIPQEQLERSRGNRTAQNDAVVKDTCVRVLLVDDHVMVRQGLRSILTAYSDIEIVAEAADGVEALCAVEQHRPALVLMDINMPNMDGIAATSRIKGRYQHVQVIGLSVNTGVENQEAMLRAGASMLLTKEAAVEQLYGAIREVMKK